LNTIRYRFAYSFPNSLYVGRHSHHLLTAPTMGQQTNRRSGHGKKKQKTKE
jgi:hypothetical protein